MATTQGRSFRISLATEGRFTKDHVLGDLLHPLKKKKLAAILRAPLAGEISWRALAGKISSPPLAGGIGWLALGQGTNLSSLGRGNQLTGPMLRAAIYVTMFPCMPKIR